MLYELHEAKHDEHAGGRLLPHLRPLQQEPVQIDTELRRIATDLRHSVTDPRHGATDLSPLVTEPRYGKKGLRQGVAGLGRDATDLRHRMTEPRSFVTDLGSQRIVPGCRRHAAEWRRQERRWAI